VGKGVIADPFESRLQDHFAESFAFIETTATDSLDSQRKANHQELGAGPNGDVLKNGNAAITFERHGPQTHRGGERRRLDTSDRRWDVKEFD
jgi:hypothetical protein